MNQTKLESAVEVFFNYLTGFLLAWSIYAFIVMPSPFLKESPFWVTTIFTFASVIRTYFWRRFFNSGMHRIAHSIISQFFNK